MESLLAHLARKERSRLRVARIDAEAQPEWIERLRITEIPTLVLIKDRRPVARLEGRVSAPEIERMISPYLAPADIGRRSPEPRGGRRAVPAHHLLKRAPASAR
jgi:thioredoxin-like negative regulator of GroEL